MHPTLEIQVKFYGAEAELVRRASEQVNLSVEQFIEYAIQQLVQEILETEEQEEAALNVELANYKPLSDEESLALAKRLSAGGVSSLDVIKEREEGW